MTQSTAAPRGELPERNYLILVDHPVYVGGMGHEPVEIDTRPERPDCITPEGVELWIERKKQRTRFLDAGGNQVGPWHRNLVPALVWSAAQGWRDPGVPDWLNDAMIAEVAAGGAPLTEGQMGWRPDGASS